MKKQPKQICKHCGGDLAIRNPKGFCDHLYYPEFCSVYNKNESKDCPDSPTGKHEFRQLIKYNKVPPTHNWTNEVCGYQFYCIFCLEKK